MSCMPCSFDWLRHQELLDRSVPVDLAETASRHHIWRKTFANVVIAWKEGQDRDAIPAHDWIEYIP